MIVTVTSQSVQSIHEQLCPRASDTLQSRSINGVSNRDSVDSHRVSLTFYKPIVFIHNDTITCVYCTASEMSVVL